MRFNLDQVREKQNKAVEKALAKYKYDRGESLLGWCMIWFIVGMVSTTLSLFHPFVFGMVVRLREVVFNNLP